MTLSVHYLGCLLNANLARRNSTRCLCSFSNKEHQPAEGLGPLEAPPWLDLAQLWPPCVPSQLFLLLPDSVLMTHPR